MYFIALLGVFAFLIAAVALFKGSVKLFKIQNRKQALLILVLSFIWIGVFAPSTADTDTDTNTNTQEAEVEVDATVQTDDSNDAVKGPSQEELQTFEGVLDMKVDDNKVIMTVTSNVPDGGVFELNLLDGNFNVLFEQVAIENGKVEHAFEIPDDWGIGYIAGSAWFRFNSDEVPQPENIKELYGENGEHMKGDLASENHTGGYNGMLDSITIAFPDEATVKEAAAQLLEDAFAEMIDISEGVIIDIKPHPIEEWDIVYVYVSDAWYYSEEHEKERFAEQIGESVQNIVFNTGMASGEIVHVYFKDSYEKDLATPKIFGGYNIKR